METKLQYVPLEELIELCIVQNTKLELGLDKVMGMNLDKQVIPTKANLSGNDLSKFYIVKPNEFIYNPRTHGKRIGLGFNETQEPFLISWNNIAFRVKATHRILPLYLYMYFCRSEWDREACFNSWGSSTEVFSWGALCKMRIPLPSIEEQEKVVSVWQGLRDIQQQNAALAKPLLQLCQSYIQECKHKYTIVELEPSIVLKEEKNTLNENLQVVGINITKRFMPTNANIDGIDTRKYKIICKKRFVFSGMQTGRDMSIRIGMYNGENRALISPAYTTFEIDESKGFLSEYIALYFMRAEMDRYGAFLSDSSVRANLDWNRFIHISIPLPPIEVQQAIVNLYRCAQECQALAKEAAEQAKTICPALIQQVIHKTK